MAIWLEGMASYVGASWTSSPPAGDLVQGFRLFREAFDALYRQRDPAANKRIMQQGLAGSGPFYRMGWRMAEAALRFAAKYRKRPEAAFALIQLGDHIAQRFQDAATAQKFIEPGLRVLGTRNEELVKREGYLFLEQGAREQAIAVFKIGVETAPREATRHYLLGECYRLLGEPESARAAYRRTLVLDDQYTPARHALARLGG